MLVFYVTLLLLIIKMCIGEDILMYKYVGTIEY